MKVILSLFGTLMLVQSAALHAAAPVTAFDANLLDAATFAERIGTTAESLVQGDKETAKLGPKAVVWTKQATTHWRGATYGAGRAAGVRYLRIGFTQAIPVGSILVGGGGSLSVLKSDAAYPGDLADDSQWLPAKRLVNGAETNEEVAEGAYGLWVLPPGTSTRALRFSHTPAARDSDTAGHLSGVWLLADRLGNVGPQSLVQSRAREDVSMKIVDESHNRTWQAWENAKEGAPIAISAEHPEIFTLTWPQAVNLERLCLLWTGFAACEVDAFTGTDDANVREAPATAWTHVGTGENLKTFYPSGLGPNWIAFDHPVSTRAIRVRITAVTKGSKGGHLEKSDRDGKRVWLGELMALVPLNNKALGSIVLPKSREESPPIPVRFTLPEAGLVTLVIEDQAGRRVRNLVSETPFPAGANIAWWDGSDDLLRDPEAARHGVYNIPTRPVAPGDYTVRGLWRKPLSLHYEFSLYSAGKPAWETADKTGCWGTTHTPPTSIATVPGSRTADGKPLIFTGCYIAEGGHGLQWLHEDGTKLGGQGWVGGNWTGAPTLAVDTGANAAATHLCYVGSVWEGELRLTAKTTTFGDQPIFKTQLGEDPRPKKPTDPQPAVLEGFEGGDRQFVLSAIAVHDGLIVCAMLRQNELIFIDAKAGAITGRLPVESPRGITFDAQGRMLVLSGRQLLAFASAKATQAETLITDGLEDPRHLIVSPTGELLISDRGNAHQIKIYSATGKPLRKIGKPGAPMGGDYDPQHLNNPNGIALDSQGRLWIAEADNNPRRVSVWSKEGKLDRTFYGPAEYGGGGVLDSQDAGKFFYRGMEFALDWKNGTDQLKRVFARPDPLLEAHGGPYSPDWPLYPRASHGTRYFTSCYTHNPTGGDNAAFIWRDDGQSARLVAAFGDAHAWEFLRKPEFRAAWPEGTTPDKENPQPDKHATFLWVDTNHDGQPQVNELKMIKGSARGVTVTRDLGFVVTQLGEDTALFSSTGFDAQGVPQYDFKPTRLGPAGGRPPSSGGNQTLLGAEWSISTNAAAPFSPYGLGGTLKGETRWNYPSAWPGLHASHEAAVPDRPGMVVGHTRLLGDFIQGPAGPMFGINANMGNMYLFTADGMFVGTLFNDIRLRPNWAAPVATRNMDVTDVSLHDENFWPSMTQTPDGKVFLIDGARTSLVRVDGLETLKRLPDQSLTVTTGDLEKAREWFDRAEVARQKSRGTGILTVPMNATAPTVDGKLDDWPLTTDWADIDRRGTKANFNSDSRPYEVSAAVRLSGDRLYAAWRTTEKNLLSNSGETPSAFFKTGGCLDLMLQTDTDQRLLVTLVKGKPHAMLYRSKVAGTKQPVAFSSPWRTIYIDSVEDVTAQVAFATDGTGNFEISVPLATLHWQPKANDIVTADLGVLRGANNQTTQRVYWSNKATAITADVPSEAELTPKLWGRWKVQ